MKIAPFAPGGTKARLHAFVAATALWFAASISGLANTGEAMAASRERIQLICDMASPAQGGVAGFCADLRAALARQSGAAVDLIKNDAFGGAGLAVRVHLKIVGAMGAEAMLEIGLAEDGRFTPDEQRAVTIHSVDGPPLAGAAETVAVELTAMLARR